MKEEIELIHPAVALIEWFKSLSKPARSDLAFLSLYPVPNSPINDSLTWVGRETEELFFEWVEQAKKMNNQQMVGHILALITAIDFFVISERGSKEDWERITGNAAKMKIDLESKGHSENITEPLELIVREGEFRGRQWQIYAESWRKLLDGPLSQKYLKAWLAIKGR